MTLTYEVNSKPKFKQLVIFAIQELLAIMAATLVVPVIVGNNMSPVAALFGAGAGTLIYVLFTKGKSPVFLGSSFAFLPSMAVAFAGGISMSLGYVGLIFGAICAGLVYVIIAIVVKFTGSKWITKIMPAVVIGPTVALIGLSLASNAVNDLFTAPAGGSRYIALIVGLITFFATIICSTFAKKFLKLIPFVVGILIGYIFAVILTVIGLTASVNDLLIIDFSSFVKTFDPFTIKSIVSVPDFTFLTAFKGLNEVTGSYLLTIVVAYVPVAFVVFAEHLADHKNLSTIINHDLLEDPGLHRTLLGDGVGSMVGALFGGCPNTTYGEAVGCVALTGNASIRTTIAAAIGAIIISFLTPFVAFINSIPNCIMGGVCIALYGFIACSGLKMMRNVDLNINANIFVVSSILIPGIGGLALTFGTDANGNPLIKITNIACALIIGIITNKILNRKPAMEGCSDTRLIKRKLRDYKNYLLEHPEVAKDLLSKDATLQIVNGKQIKENAPVEVKLAAKKAPAKKSTKK